MNLARQLPDRQGSNEPACERFRPQSPTGKEMKAILLVDALSGPARKNREDDGRQLSGHGIVIIIGDYVVSTCFTSKVGPRYAAATPTIPVETISPPFVC